MKTGKNINHAGLNIKTPMTMAFDFLSGKKNTDDDEYLKDGSIIGTFNNPDTASKTKLQKFKADIALKKEQSMLTGELKRQEELKKRIEKERIEKEAKDKIARIEAAKIEQAEQQAANTINISTATQAFDNTRGQSSSDRGEAASGMGGGSQQATSAGSSNTNRNDGGWGWADGGVVSLKNGGSTNGSGKAALSAKVKELMDDGYEFGEAVKEAMKQGYMNGGRIKSYFKGGLVSLRGR